IVQKVLEEGLAAGLVSDAGTPLISDPGYVLVSAMLKRQVPVRAAPGPSAVMAALSVSGLPPGRFRFEGFLPPKTQARGAQVEILLREECTLVFFESPRRIKRTVQQLREIAGDARLACVARELTKLHETVYRGTLLDIAANLARDPFGDAGEFAVIVAGAAPT